MDFPLTPRSMTLDDLGLLKGQILSEFRLISLFWEVTTAKRMKIDPCLHQNCSPLNVLLAVYRLCWYLMAFRRWGLQTREGWVKSAVFYL